MENRDRDTYVLLALWLAVWYEHPIIFAPRCFPDTIKKPLPTSSSAYRSTVTTPNALSIDKNRPFPLRRRYATGWPPRSSCFPNRTAARRVDNCVYVESLFHAAPQKLRLPDKWCRSLFQTPDSADILLFCRANLSFKSFLFVFFVCVEGEKLKSSGTPLEGLFSIFFCLIIKTDLLKYPNLL